MVLHDLRYSEEVGVNVQNALRWAKEGARELRAEIVAGPDGTEEHHARTIGHIAGAVFRQLDNVYDPHAMQAARALCQARAAEAAA